MSVFYEVLIFIFIFMIFFFSLCEIAVVSASRSIIVIKKENGNPFAWIALGILDRADEIISLVMIGSNVCSISATAFITLVATRSYHVGEKDLLFVTVIQTVIFLVVCEAIPKIVSRFNAETILLLVAAPLRGLMFAGYPLVRGSLVISSMIKRKYSETTITAAERARDEIDALVRLGSSTGIIDETRKTYISEILSLHKITVIEALTPTINIISVEADTQLDQVSLLISKSRFSRIPVYLDRVDNIIGYIYYRDILDYDTQKDVTARDVMRKAVYVPLTKSLYSLYRQMQTTRNHIVFAVNEYGAVVGMVTREDIAEEIVGEIQTRDHHREDLIRRTDSGVHGISGSLDIDIFTRIFQLEIEKKGFETVSGFVSYLAGKIPAQGDVFDYQGVIIQVEKADEKMIHEITAKNRVSRRKKNVLSRRA